jgi:site-specific DNA recombinase
MPRADASRRRCAIYTRKSSEEGLEQEFNSLAAQCEACEAFIRSQRNEGWVLAKTRYNDGGFSGGNLERPALEQLIADIQAGRIDIVVVYKVDRLTRSLADFARLVELFDAEAVSFVSVTQQFNTTSSMGRLTLNMSHYIDLTTFIFHPASFRRPIASLDGSWVEETKRGRAAMNFSV